MLPKALRPEAKVYFDEDNRILKVEGTDNLSLPSVVRQGSTFIITDKADNNLKLVFDKLKQEGKEIKAGLFSLQYGINPVIKLPETEFKYEWSLDRTTNQIKELEQEIDSEGQFEIKAKYSLEKIVINRWHQN